MWILSPINWLNWGKINSWWVLLKLIMTGALFCVLNSQANAQDVSSQNKRPSFWEESWCWEMTEWQRINNFPCWYITPDSDNVVYVAQAEQNMPIFWQNSETPYNLDNLYSKWNKYMETKTKELGVKIDKDWNGLSRVDLEKFLDVDMNLLKWLIQRDSKLFDKDPRVESLRKEQKRLEEEIDSVKQDESKRLSLQKDLNNVAEEITQLEDKLNIDAIRNIKEKLSEKLSDTELVALVSLISSNPELLKDKSVSLFLEFVKSQISSLNDQITSFRKKFKDVTYLSSESADKFSSNRKNTEQKAIRTEFRQISWLEWTDKEKLMDITWVNFLSAFHVISKDLPKIKSELSKYKADYDAVVSKVWENPIFETEKKLFEEAKYKYEAAVTKAWKSKWYMPDWTFDSFEISQLQDLIYLYEKSTDVKVFVEKVLFHANKFVRYDNVVNTRLLAESVSSDNVFYVLADYDRDWELDEDDNWVISWQTLFQVMNDIERQMNLEWQWDKFYKNLSEIFQNWWLDVNLKNKTDLHNLLKSNPEVGSIFTRQLSYFSSKKVDLSYIFRYWVEWVKIFFDAQKDFYEKHPVWKLMKSIFEKHYTHLINQVKKLKEEGITDPDFAASIDEIDQNIQRPWFAEQLWETMLPMLTNFWMFYFSEMSGNWLLGASFNTNPVDSNLDKFTKNYEDSIVPQIGFSNTKSWSVIVLWTMYNFKKRLDKETVISGWLWTNFGFWQWYNLLPILSFGISKTLNVSDMEKAWLQNFELSKETLWLAVRTWWMNLSSYWATVWVEYWENRKESLDLKLAQYTSFLDTLFDVSNSRWRLTTDSLVDLVRQRLWNPELIDLGKMLKTEVLPVYVKNKLIDESLAASLIASPSDYEKILEQYLVSKGWAEAVKDILEKIRREIKRKVEKKQLLIDFQSSQWTKEFIAQSLIEVQSKLKMEKFDDLDFNSKYVTIDWIKKYMQDVFIKYYADKEIKQWYTLNGGGLWVNLLSLVSTVTTWIPVVPTFDISKMQENIWIDKSRQTFDAIRFTSSWYYKEWNIWANLDQFAQNLWNYMMIDWINVISRNWNIVLSSEKWTNILDELKKRWVAVYVWIEDSLLKEVWVNWNEIVIWNVGKMNYNNLVSVDWKAQALILGSKNDKLMLISNKMNNVFAWNIPGTIKEISFAKTDTLTPNTSVLEQKELWLF